MHIPEIFVVSFYIGCSILITCSIIIGTFFNYLKVFFYLFYVLGISLFIFYLTNFINLKKIYTISFSKYKILSLILILLSLSIYIYYPLKKTIPYSDAVETHLAISRYIYEFNNVSPKTSIFLKTGHTIANLPGIDILRAYIFTICNSLNPINLSFLEIVFLFTYSLLTYNFSLKCGSSDWEAIFAMVLMSNMPYWGFYYFPEKLHYIDLEASFMTSASIYLIILLMESKIFRSHLALLGLTLFATISSKPHAFLASIFLVIFLLKSSYLWLEFRELLTPFLIIGYLLGSILFTRLVSLRGNYSITLDTFIVVISIIPFLIFIKTDFNKHIKLTKKITFFLLIILLFTNFWYFKNLYVIGTFHPSIPIGNGYWAEEIIKITKLWDLSNQFNIISNNTYKILNSLFLFIFFVPFILGLINFLKKKEKFSVSIILWLSIGLSLYLSFFKLRNYRYISYFFLPIPLIIGKGLFLIVEPYIYKKNFLNFFTFISIIFLITFIPIISVLMKWPIILFIVSSLSFIIGYEFHKKQIKIIIKLPPYLLKVYKKSIFFIRPILLISILILSTQLIFIQFSQEINEENWRTNLYEKVSLHARKDGVLINNIGGIGIYYMTGINSLKIHSRWPLAELRPFIESKDLYFGSQFLINNLTVRSIIIPSESVSNYWRVRYTNLLKILPELRLFHNPNYFNAAYYDRGTYYLLNYNNNTIKPHGVLDIIVKGKDTTEESSLFIPRDYGESLENYITCSDNGVKLVIFLYFPYNIIEKTNSVNYNTATKITVIDSFEDIEKKRSIIMSSSSSVNLSKIVEIEVCTLKGNITAESTEISIEDIKIFIKDDNFKAYYNLVPKNVTCLMYYPEGNYNWPNHTWSHMYTNFIEKISSLEE
jgi:hypothetical protein